GIVHRDIKPANIVIVPDAEAYVRPKLLDFGIARIVAGVRSKRLTDTGHVVGTPYYMSPEQASGRRDVDHQTDVWALCAVAYEMLTGELPFFGDNYNAVISE